MQAQQFQNAKLANQQGQFGLDAQKGLSSAYAAATDPTTGQVDFNKLQAAVAADPAAASRMPDILTSSLQQKQGSQTLQSGNLDLIAKQRAQVNSVLTQIATNPKASRQDVINGALSLVGDSHVPANIAQQVLSTMPPEGSPPDAYQKWAGTLAAQSAGPAAQQAQLTPNAAAINTGPATVGVNTNPYAPGGMGAPQFSIQNGLAPAQAASPVPVLGPNGQPGSMPAGQYGVQTGAITPAQAGMPGQGSAAQGGGLGTGRYPALAQQPGAPAGFMPTQVPPGQAELAAGGAQRVGALQQAAGSAKNQMHSYDLALDAAQKAVTGPGGAKIVNPQAILETLGFGTQGTGDRVKDTQILNSQLASAADQAAASLGLSGSDARLAAAKAGQPSGELNAPALVQQIKYVKGLQQGVLDKQSAVQNYLAQNGNNTANLGQFESQFNKAFNPDVSYIRSLSTPADQAAEIAKLKQQGKYADWRKSYVDMKALGAF